MAEAVGVAEAEAGVEVGAAVGVAVASEAVTEAADGSAVGNLDPRSGLAALPPVWSARRVRNRMRPLRPAAAFCARGLPGAEPSG